NRFGDEAYRRYVLVEPQKPTLSPAKRPFAEDGFRAARNAAIGFDQVNGAAGLALVDLRESRGGLLVPDVFALIARRLAPAIDRGAAHAAVAVVQHGGASGRRIGHYFNTSDRLLKSSVQRSGFLGSSGGFRSSGAGSAYSRSCSSN